MLRPPLALSATIRHVTVVRDMDAARERLTCEGVALAIRIDRQEFHSVRGRS